VLVLLAHPLARLVDRAPSAEEAGHHFAKALDITTQNAFRAVQQIQKDVRRYGVKNVQLGRATFLKSLFEEQYISIYLFRNDELALWSHNTLSPQAALQTARLGTEIARLDNGWYRLLYLTDGVDEYVAAIWINREFPHRNTYLTNGFAPQLETEGIAEIDTKPHSGWIKLRASHQYFYLRHDPVGEVSPASYWVYLTTLLAGLALLLLALYRTVATRLSRSGWSAFIVLCIVFVALRAGWLHLGWPSYIGELRLFSPSLYASSHWFPSLGDLFINVLLLFCLALAARFRFLGHSPNGNPSARRVAPLLFALLFALAIWINHITKGLVVNSNIPFEIDNITSLNAYSLLGLIAMALLYFSWVLLSDATALYLRNATVPQAYVALSGLGVLLLYLLITHALGMRDLIFLLWPAMVFLVLYLSRRHAERGLRLSHASALLSIFALVGAHNYLKYQAARDRGQQRILADKLAENNDPVAELLFTELKPALLRDAGIKKLFFENELHTRQVLEDFVIPRYFSGYWGKYQVQVYAYLPDGSAWGKLPNVRPMPLSEIRRRIDEYGEPTALDSDLYYISVAGDPATYIAVLPLHYQLQPEPDGYLMLEFSIKLSPQYMGFPALLIDESSRDVTLMPQYSAAVYIDGRLARTRGSYSYQSTPERYLSLGTPPFFDILGGMEHYVSTSQGNTVVIISRATKSFLAKATTFSYLWAIFGVLFMLARFVANQVPNRRNAILNLNQRIQLLLILLTLLSMILFAFATRYYIAQQYTLKNQRLLSEKTQSVHLELENKLEEEYALDYSQMEYINRLLTHFSSIFFTDIHLYTPDGDLLASSQMRMFNEGIVSRKMNPAAYAHLSYLKEVEYIHEEHIGRMKYISAYIPFYNSQGALLAYLNLPYFGRQAELDQEISTFLVAVVNIFVLLLLLAVLAGLFMSQWITAPLRIIRESLATMDPGKSNRIIDYNSRDEIGLLVTEYNAKIAELENNAERLAQSERESAWREMARQVAHEIKNPLTPMKLSVQHLQRYAEQGRELSAERVAQTAQNLNEQIDALSAIASAFSNFARMPQARFEVIDLLAVINSAIDLFSHVEKVRFVSDFHGLNRADVYADKEQMLRVFNNLIKNAIQAIPDARQGIITLSVERRERHFLIAVADNGQGISEEARSKIFMPNFTTKSRGMGLGLAMTKNIVEQSAGSIWFETVLSVGTTFYISLPCSEQEPSFG
jgi:signal transduction histidine kinase